MYFVVWKQARTKTMHSILIGKEICMIISKNFYVDTKHTNVNIGPLVAALVLKAMGLGVIAS